MEDHINVTFVCPKCGGGSIRVEDKADDASAVSCAGCGVRFDQTWGDVKQAAQERAKGALVDSFRDAFKGIPGIKIT